MKPPTYSRYSRYSRHSAYYQLTLLTVLTLRTLLTLLTYITYSTYNIYIIYICTHIHTYIHTYVKADMYVCVCVCVCVRVRACVRERESTSTFENSCPVTASLRHAACASERFWYRVSDDCPGKKRSGSGPSHQVLRGVSVVFRAALFVVVASSASGCICAYVS